MPVVLSAQAQNDPKPFITTWETEGANEKITIPTASGSTYNYTISWGDGSTSSNQTGSVTHTYAREGTYTVTISGTFPRIQLASGGQIGEAVPSPATGQIRTIKQWGDIAWTSMAFAFAGCDSLTIEDDAGIPDFSRVTNMEYMFKDANLNGNISNWDVSNVENMRFMFEESDFTGSLTNWNVSSVTDMFAMFSRSSFTGDISGWDVSSVTNMAFMFAGSPFNGNISEWDVSSVTNMAYVFERSLFNGNISEWDVSSVTNMAFMFAGSPFNGNISEWDVSSVTNMAFMFTGSDFNGDVSEWNVSSVVNMEFMFAGSEFNRDVSRWNVGNVTDMLAMFERSGFNGDVSKWNVSNVTNMKRMFGGSSFNGDISEWDISEVKEMDSMLLASPMSSANYDALLVGWSTLTESETRIPTGITFGPPRIYSCRGKAGRDTLTGSTHNWVITRDDFVSMRTDLAVLPTLTAQCSLTKNAVTAPTAKNNCEGTGTAITATTDIAFPITSDTTITWTYTDDGKSITQTQQIMIGDSTPPMPALMTLPLLESCSPIDSLTAPTAMDDCSGMVTAATTTTTPIMTGTTIIWTYTDNAGNDTMQTQRVIITVNSIKPMPDKMTLDPVVSECEVDSLIAPTATDNCSGIITATTAIATPIKSDTTITWIYTNSQGNDTTQTQQVTITADATKPMPDKTTLTKVTKECELASVELASPTATDNCDGRVGGTPSVTFPIRSDTTIIWTYTDNTGNISTQTQQVVITACPLGTADYTAEVIVFPNPVPSTGNYIEVWSPVESPVSILDLNGRLLQEGTTNTKMNIIALRNGLYLIQLPDGHLLKFIKK